MRVFIRQVLLLERVARFQNHEWTRMDTNAALQRSGCPPNTPKAAKEGFGFRVVRVFRGSIRVDSRSFVVKSVRANVC
jgi:hypothetical protein